MAKRSKEPQLPQPDEAATVKKGSFVSTLLAFGLATLIAGGAGAGLAFKDLPVKKNEGAAQVDTAPHGKGSDADHGKTKPVSALRELPPIITNLALPDTLWIRLEAAVLLQSSEFKDADVLVAQTASDLLAYLRTVSLNQIQGASGLRYLKQDLAERATIRSKGQIKDLIIHALVVQ